MTMKGTHNSESGALDQASMHCYGQQEVLNDPSLKGWDETLKVSWLVPVLNKQEGNNLQGTLGAPEGLGQRLLSPRGLQRGSGRWRWQSGGCVEAPHRRFFLMVY